MSELQNYDKMLEKLRSFSKKLAPEARAELNVAAAERLSSAASSYIAIGVPSFDDIVAYQKGKVEPEDVDLVNRMIELNKQIEHHAEEILRIGLEIANTPIHTEER